MSRGAARGRIDQPIVPRNRDVINEGAGRVARGGWRAWCRVFAADRMGPQVRRRRRRGRTWRRRASPLAPTPEAADRGRDQHAGLGGKACELSGSLSEHWAVANDSATRQILGRICLNPSLENITLVPEWREPSDTFVGGLSASSSRGDKTCTLVYERASPRFVQHILPQSLPFTEDAIESLIEPGLYRKR